MSRPSTPMETSRPSTPSTPMETSRPSTPPGNSPQRSAVGSPMSGISLSAKSTPPKSRSSNVQNIINLKLRVFTKGTLFLYFNEILLIDSFV
jgi:hypothetical protein